MKKKLHLYWLWMPVVYLILLTLGFFIFFVPFIDKGTNWKYLGVGVISVSIYALVLSPIMSISYCKNIRNMGWKKYLCCIYNAIMMGGYSTVYWITKLHLDRELIEIIFLTVSSIVSSLSLFVSIPALICGLITLITYDKKNRKAEDNSLSQ